MSSQHRNRAQALDAWESDLCRREAALTHDRAAFEQRITTFVDTKASDIAAACELVQSVFPQGIVFPPWQAGSGGSRH